MKKPIIFGSLVFLVLSSFGQTPVPLEDLKHYRIQLDNRTNRHLKEVPKQLLEGYCKGIYKAYYPKAVFNEVNFGDFLAHFRWGEPVLNESILCGEDYCSNPAFSQLYQRFNSYLDYYEHNYYNTTTSRMERKVEFVQLTYSVEVYGTVYTFKGPVFRMDEIERTILVKNESNDSQPQSIKYAFELGRFYSVEIAEADIKTKQRRTNREDDMQEH